MYQKKFIISTHELLDVLKGKKTTEIGIKLIYLYIYQEFITFTGWEI